MDQEKLRQELMTALVPLIGGKDNLARKEFRRDTLHITLKDQSLADPEALRELHGVTRVELTRGRLRLTLTEDYFEEEHKMADNKKIAQDILAAVGGKDNILQAVHCMTRLRLTLRNNDIINEKDVKAIQGVAGCQFIGTQFQVIIGTNVPKVYDEFVKLSGVVAEAAINENLDTKAPKSVKSIINGILDYVSGAVSPLIPVFIVSGLVKALVTILGPSLLGILQESSDLYTLFTFVGDAGMYYLPILLAVSASKKLNCNWVVAAYLAFIMVHPTFMAMATEGANFTVYGIPCNVQNYSSSVMPILLTVWVMSYVEKWLRKYTPDVLQILLVPFATVLIMTPITLCALGPIGSFVGTYVCSAIIALYNVFGPTATTLIGGLFLPLVFTGMHPMFYVYLFTTFPTMGYDTFFLPSVVASSWAMAGIFLAIMVRFKKKENKVLAVTGFTTWLIGSVGEPFMYGILLRYKKLLFASIIGGAAGGLVAGLTHLTAHALIASNGIYGLIAFLGGSTWNYIALIITLAVSVIVSFLVAMAMKLDEDEA